MTTPVHHRYSAYGLAIRSELALPFAAGSAGGEADVTIRFGPTPAGLDRPADPRRPWQCAPGVFLLDAEGVARYMVRAGREIAVEVRGGSEADVRALLLGSVLAACLQQRGLLTLHASSIATDAGAVLFAGKSRSGKSTLLAALVRRGYTMLADDVTGVGLDGAGHPVALPAFPSMRLWSDSVDKLSWRAMVNDRVRHDQDKFYAATGRFCASSSAVRAIFALAVHDRTDVTIEPVSPDSAFRVLLQYTYRKRFLRGSGRNRDHFRAVAALAKQVPIQRATRPAHPFLLDELADEVERRLRAAPPPDRDPETPRPARREASR